MNQVLSVIHPGLFYAFRTGCCVIYADPDTHKYSKKIRHRTHDTYTDERMHYIISNKTDQVCMKILSN